MPGWRLPFIDANWREFQGKSAMEEDPDEALLQFHYEVLMEAAGWRVTHEIESPLPTERFQPKMITGLQNRRSLGTLKSWAILAKK